MDSKFSNSTLYILNTALDREQRLIEGVIYELSSAKTGLPLRNLERRLSESLERHDLILRQLYLGQNAGWWRQGEYPYW